MTFRFPPVLAGLLVLAPLAGPAQPAASETSPPQTAPPVHLDAQDCETIRAYDRRIFSPSFLNQWAHMALTHEACGGSTYDCKRERMRRWPGGFTLVLPPQKSWERLGEEAARVAAGARDAAQFYARTLGLDPAETIHESDRMTSDRPQIVVYAGTIDELVSIASGLPDSLRSDFRTDYLRRGRHSRRPTCVVTTHNLKASPAESYLSLIFISLENRWSLLGACGREEVFNAFVPNDPVGDGSLFEDAWGHDDLGPVFGPRERALLRLLHHADVTPGLSYDDAKAAAEKAIRQDCGG
ncbi:hypothetical protein P2H44_11235 [Albimonas sp. CAU 1670]|uniref:hypothetical protein n=1 Tax=Albimonas sp. CAU 1670 TaxID=3032599 RepID=UPI0023DBB9E9|nr:hypothetical protein [Albimonas sp. CAU 1670]MDF2233126.1 hypothetical protein [Albimonas sp. CAU 1670]